MVNEINLQEIHDSAKRSYAESEKVEMIVSKFSKALSKRGYKFIISIGILLPEVDQNFLCTNVDISFECYLKHFEGIIQQCDIPDLLILQGKILERVLALTNKKMKEDNNEDKSP